MKGKTYKTKSEQIDKKKKRKKKYEGVKREKIREIEGKYRERRYGELYKGTGEKKRKKLNGKPIR